MSAQASVQTAQPQTSTAATLAANSSQTLPASQPVATTTASGTTHIIQSGESLYTIARKYGVTTDSIVHANGMSSPDKIQVGQIIKIPGSTTSGEHIEDSSVPKIAAAPTPSAQTQSASSASRLEVASVSKTQVNPETVTPAAPLDRETETASVRSSVPTSSSSSVPQTRTEETQTRVSSVAQPAVPTAQAAQTQTQAQSGTDAGGFKWPLKGSVVTSFASSRTGINIAAQEGAAVRAAGAGDVIYVGNAVEGYGNLVLIRHDNGYVSAYAHLKDVTVSKGAHVSAGETIGSAGMTGGLKTPQLHFELRQGATPVDPVPMLAG